MVYKVALRRSEEGYGVTVPGLSGCSSGSTIEGVSAVEFHPAYIVVREQDGSGRVFFTERTNSLSWRVAGK
jgi:hypothetical protein